jgi:hypothetical protein
MVMNTSVSAQESGGVRINAHAGDISNVAGSGGTAETRIGTTTGGNTSIDAHVGGSVATRAGLGRTARTDIGSADGNADISVDVRGSVITDARRRDAGTYIGATTSDVGHAAGTNVHISGSVINSGGDLVVGGRGVCVGYRNDRCCVEFYLSRCVLNRYPNPPDEPCAPGYVYTLGWCRLYSDFSHSFSGR